MSHTTALRASRVLVLFLAGALGCGSDLLLPDPPGGGENVALSKVEGDNQTGVVGEELSTPLKVQVLTQREQPAVGRQIEFVMTSDPAAGVVSPSFAFTDVKGEAVARWTLGTSPGPHTVIARVVNGESEAQTQQFVAEAKAAPPDTLAPQSSISQAGLRGRDVETPPVVLVVDKYGNPVADQPVAWQVTAGQGKVSEPSTTTGADGTATVGWELGNRIGVHRLTASVGQVTGSPATFSATVLF